MKPTHTIVLLTTLLLPVLAQTLAAAPACCPDGDAFTPQNRILDADSSVRVERHVAAGLGLTTATVTHGVLDRTYSMPGFLETLPEHEGFLATRVPGRIVEIFAREGDTVRRGQTVFRIETRVAGSSPSTISVEAPLDGVLTELRVRLGQPVEPDHVLAAVVDFSRLRVVAAVPTRRAALLSASPSARLAFDAFPQSSFEARFLRRADSADPTRPTLTAYFEAVNADDLLRPGLRCTVTLVLPPASHQHQTLVPREAILGENGNHFVYAIDANDELLFHYIPVTVLESDDRHFAVAADLGPGDRVVTTGGHALRFAGAVHQARIRSAADAAHGHSHDHDDHGHAHGNDGGHGHGHGHDHEHEHFLVYALGTSTVLLLGLLSLQSFRVRRQGR